MVLNGGFPPGTVGNPMPYGMPPFAQPLSDDEVAAVVTYIRTSWGNRGSAVSAEANALAFRAAELRSRMINSTTASRQPNDGACRRRSSAAARRAPWCWRASRPSSWSRSGSPSTSSSSCRGATVSTARRADHNVERSRSVERRWAIAIASSSSRLLVGMAAFAGIHQATMPQARVETIDPTTLHVSGEFIESNLGSAVEADGSVTVRAIGQQYSFTPQCIAGARRYADHPPRHQRRCGAWLPYPRHQCQHDAGAGLCLGVHDAFRAGRAIT